jgi:hypothetical protein
LAENTTPDQEQHFDKFKNLGPIRETGQRNWLPKTAGTSTDGFVHCEFVNICKNEI